ncbi:MAG: hypothetical protein J1E64_15260 [Acetatifactor sp.]|nr:hypothetical protein [Acetatifactor sp.]
MHVIKLADSSSKIIFEDPLLCSQFLRDYVEDVPCLKHVRPEDIEDVSDRYVPLFAVERNSDRVKKVHIKNGTPFFLVSLIEHKTKVEYNVAYQQMTKRDHREHLVRTDKLTSDRQVRSDEERSYSSSYADISLYDLYLGDL